MVRCPNERSGNKAVPAGWDAMNPRRVPENSAFERNKSMAVLTERNR